MIETLTAAIATAVTTVILPKMAEGAYQKLGEKALEKGGELIKTTRQTVEKKLQESGIFKLLEKAITKPTEANRQVLEAVIVSQMEEDEAFAQRLQELVEQLKPELPELQSILDNALIRGGLEMEGIDIKNEGKPTGKQVIGRNLKVGKNAKFGKISIHNKGEEE